MKKESRPDIPKLEITNIGSFDSEGKPIYWAFNGKSHPHSVGIYYSDDWYLIGGYTADELRDIKKGAEMTDKSDLPKVIYLIPDGDGYVWCEDPAPGIDMKEKDAIKYLSTEAFIEQACEAVDAKKKKTIPGRVSISMFDDAYNDGLDAAKQAIRDRFEGEK